MVWGMLISLSLGMMDHTTNMQTNTPSQPTNLLTMSPHSTAQRLLSELKSRLTTETDPLTKQLLKDKIKSTSQILIRESVRISLARDQQTRSFGLTHREAPIKCGLRGATGHSLPNRRPRRWSRTYPSLQKALLSRRL